MFGVLAERRLVADNPQGWAGVLSLPRVLGLGDGNRLLMDPTPEVCSRGEPDWEFAEKRTGGRTVRSRSTRCMGTASKWSRRSILAAPVRWG